MFYCKLNSTSYRVQMPPDGDYSLSTTLVSYITYDIHTQGPGAERALSGIGADPVGALVLEHPLTTLSTHSKKMKIKRVPAEAKNSPSHTETLH